MNRSVNILLLIAIIFLLPGPAACAWQGTYKTDTKGLFVVKETISTVPDYNPPWPNRDHCGPMRILAFKITNNWTETKQQDVFHQGNMKLHIFHPEVETGKNPASQPLPVIVYGYGSGFLFPYQDPLGDPNPEIIPIAHYFAKRGYIVVVPEYRIGINLFEPELAKRAVWRAVQDIRVVNRYARQLSTAAYVADQNEALSFIGWSAGGLIALHNLYLNDNNRPTSTTTAYSPAMGFGCSGIKNPITTIYRNTYSLGGIDSPWMNGKAFAPIGTVRDATPEISIALSGAIGELSWISNPAPGIIKPFALMTAHHPDDGVVPYGQGKVYTNFELFRSHYFDFTEVYGSNSIHQLYTGQQHADKKPYLYSFYPVKSDCYTTDCIPGNAGGEYFALPHLGGIIKKKVWHHAVHENGANTDLMEAMATFIANARTEWQNTAISRMGTPIAKEQINIYPNPTKDGHIYIDYKGPRQIHKITCTDVTGKTIDLPYTTQAQGTLQIDLQQTAKGLLIIQIHTDHNIITKKIQAH